MINQQQFLKKYNIDITAFDKTGLVWEDLTQIYTDYCSYNASLEPTAIYIFNSLMSSERVHSVRYRLKDAEHIVEKIIRKKIENKESNITLENYKKELTDIIGLRALHLFKDDWEQIDDYIRKTWNLKQKPIANYRKGDSQQIIDFFIERDCEPREHKYGYRSVHYIIETQPAKEKYFAEIQVRTIFEEGWAEIDHTIRYPYDLDNAIFFQFLLILNRLAGSADEMGSFIKFLKTELQLREEQFKKQIDEKNQIIADLETKINKLNLRGKELEEVKKDLDRLRQQKQSTSILGIDGKEFAEYFLPIRTNPNFISMTEALKSLGNVGDVISFPTLQNPKTFLVPQKDSKNQDPADDLTPKSQ